MSTEPVRQTIVAGFDDTPQSHSAIHWAAGEAKSRGALLRIITAWDPSPVTSWNLPQLAEWRKEARTRAEWAASSARHVVGGGLDVEALAIEGSPGRVLADESRCADLVVLGSAGHIGLAGLLAGSVSRHLLHRTACPLVVLGPNATPDPTRRLVLSPTLDPDGETYDWVARWVERRAVPLYVVASFEITAGIADLTLNAAYRDVRAAVREQNDEWIASLQRAIEHRAVVRIEVTSSVIEGMARDVLERETQAGDLLVVPAGCEHYVPLARGECPVAVVPAVRRRAKQTAPAPEQAIATSRVATAPSAVR
jgi:nucleotide-binding universal stress UspA family protein